MDDVGRVAAELMDQLDQEYADMEDVEYGVVAVIVEVNYKDSDGDDTTSVQFRCNDPRRWIQLGLFGAAKRAALASSWDEDEDEDEDEDDDE